MSLVERMIGAAKLDVRVFEEVEHDQNAMGQALIVVVLASVAAGIGALRAGSVAIVASLLGSLVGWFLWALVIYLVGAKLMPEPQTKADLGQLLRTLGFAATPGILRIVGIIPVLGPILAFAAGVWMLIAMVIAVRQALDYQSTGRAAVVCFLGWVVFMVIGLMVGLTFGIAGAASGAFS